MKKKGKLSFNKRKHTYTLNGEELTSVTTFVHSFFAPFDANGIAKRLASFPINKHQKKGVRYWKSEWKKSAKEGTIVHKEIEDFIKTQGDIKNNTLNPKSYNAIMWLTDFLKDKDFNPSTSNIYTEYQIYNDKLKLAGTIDCLLITNDTWYIIDWKTNKAITKDNRYNKYGITSSTKLLDDCNWIHYCLQLNTYKYMLKHSNNFSHDIKLLLVHLRDKDIEIHSVPNMENTVKAMIGEHLASRNGLKQPKKAIKSKNKDPKLV